MMSDVEPTGENGVAGAERHFSIHKILRGLVNQDDQDQNQEIQDL